jgi:hypothetical protein
MGGIESGHALAMPVGDMRMFYSLTGVVVLSMKGAGEKWRRDTVRFGVGIPGLAAAEGLQLEQWAPSITLNSIGNDHEAINAGWAVDGFRLIGTDRALDTVTVEVDLAVRDVDGYVYRLGYSIGLLGKIVPRSPAL